MKKALTQLPPKPKQNTVSSLHYDFLMREHEHAIAKALHFALIELLGGADGAEHRAQAVINRVEESEWAP